MAFSPVPPDCVMTELPPMRLMFPSVSVETTPGVVLPVSVKCGRRSRSGSACWWCRRTGC